MPRSKADDRKQRRRREAYRAQGGRCIWCGYGMLFLHQVHGKQNHPLLCTAEHLTPKSHKGTNARSNIVAACYRCNTARKNKPLEIWVSINRMRLEQLGNPQHFEVMLSFLKAHGIDAPQVGHPGNGPDQHLTAESPPLMDPSPAP